MKPLDSHQRDMLIAKLAAGLAEQGRVRSDRLAELGLDVYERLYVFGTLMARADAEHP